MALAREKEWAPCSVPADFFSGCRRAASFPFFGEHTISPIGVLKVRSQSESEGLNNFHFAQSKLETLWRIPRESFQEREERSDCGSDADSASSSDDSACPSPSLAEPEDIEIPSKRVKNVRFADDCGQELVCIRISKESSDQPPVLSPRILRRWAGADYDDKPKVILPQWKAEFTQPASEYVKFRETLEKGKVALENIVIQSDKLKINGTIKVMNIAFEKRVFLRITTNNWRSYIDRPATYQPSSSKTHDTFTFQVDIPSPSENVKCLEFCVCFVGQDAEYWDSNGGNNFKIICVDPNPPVKRPPHTLIFSGHRKLDRDDAYKMDSDDWTSFASWKNLSTDGPYW